MIALALLVALVVAVVGWQRWGGDAAPAAARDLPTDPVAALTSQLAALSQAPNREAFVAAAGDTPAARRFAAQVWSAREALGVTAVSLTRISGGDIADEADGSTRATVRVVWSESAASPTGAVQDASVVVRLKLAPLSARQYAVTGAVAGEAGQLPMWLAGPVRVLGTPQARLIKVGDGGVDQAAQRVQAAAAAVTRITGSTAPLVVVDPTTPQTAAAILGRPVADVVPIAGISIRLTGPQPLVMLNPATFSAMDDRAAQIVVTHEATHVMTGAVGSPMETWVSEGFADWVALHDDTAPLSISAGAILQQVRSTGAPEALPTTADFNATADGVGAVYESAWLIYRLLGQSHDDAAITTFYSAVRDGADLDATARRVFQTDLASLTAQWRDELTTLSAQP